MKSDVQYLCNDLKIKREQERQEKLKEVDEGVVVANGIIGFSWGTLGH